MLEIPECLPAPSSNATRALEKKQASAALSKLISASIGDITVVMSHSRAHKYYALADIEWLVLPAVVADQFYVVEAVSKEHGFRVPVTCVTWASVSNEVDQRIRKASARRIRLRPDECNSGEHIWLVDMAGDPRALSGALKTLIETRFKGKQVNVATHSADGVVRVQTLAELAAAAQEAAG